MKIDSWKLGYYIHFVKRKEKKSQFVIITSLLKFIPAYFFIKSTQGNKLGSPCSYSSWFDLDFFKFIFLISCEQLSRIMSAYTNNGFINAM